MTSRGAEWIEAVLGAVAGAVVLALAGFLAWQGLRDGADLPELSVLPVAAPDAEVRFIVRNDSGETATDVAISLVLVDEEGRTVSERGLVIDYVPGHSEVTGGFLLPTGFERLSPRLAVDGYLDP
jgi:uncharacterized protein (TIGR02588 family)